MVCYRILIVAVVMQLCLGATYAWSAFVLPLKQATGMHQGTAQLPFFLFSFAFPATMIVAGTLLLLWGIGGLIVGGAVALGLGLRLTAQKNNVY